MRPSAFVADFGERVRQLRVQRDLSQEQLAFEAGLHRTAISFIERGRRKATLDTIERLARALKVEPADLMPPLRPVTQRKSGRGRKG